MTVNVLYMCVHRLSVGVLYVSVSFVYMCILCVFYVCVSLCFMTLCVLCVCAVCLYVLVSMCLHVLYNELIPGLMCAKFHFICNHANFHIILILAVFLENNMLLNFKLKVNVL